MMHPSFLIADVNPRGTYVEPDPYAHLVRVRPLRHRARLTDVFVTFTSIPEPIRFAVLVCEGELLDAAHAMHMTPRPLSLAQRVTRDERRAETVVDVTVDVAGLMPDERNDPTWRQRFAAWRQARRAT